MTTSIPPTQEGRAFSHSSAREPNGALARPLPSSGVYLITAELDDGDALLERTRQALGTGLIRILQYRDKRGPSLHARLHTAQRLQALCRQHGAAQIINDDLSLAVEIGADGVHLGEDDVDPATARARLGPERLVGVSCYDSLQRAEDALRAGADHVAFGAFHPTRSKSGVRRASPQLLIEAKGRGWPAVAIGGIDAHNAAPLARAGARWLAVIHAVFGAEDPAAAVLALHSAFAQGAFA